MVPDLLRLASFQEQIRKDTLREDPMRIQQEDGCLQAKERSLRGNQCYWHPDLGLSASRTLRQYIPAVHDTRLWSFIVEAQETNTRCVNEGSPWWGSVCFLGCWRLHSIVSGGPQTGTERGQEGQCHPVSYRQLLDRFLGLLMRLWNSDTENPGLWIPHFPCQETSSIFHTT